MIWRSFEMNKNLAVNSLVALFVIAQVAFAKDPCKEACWINVRTGKSAPTVPSNGANFGVHQKAVQISGPNQNEATNPVNNEAYVRVPCPQPAAVAPAPPETPKEQPNPLGKILQQVSVGVGVSGGQTVGRDNHKGDHRVTDHKRNSSTKKLPAGCKCHPCTCSPCRCGG